MICRACLHFQSEPGSDLAAHCRNRPEGRPRGGRSSMQNGYILEIKSNWPWGFNQLFGQLFGYSVIWLFGYLVICLFGYSVTRGYFDSSIFDDAVILAPVTQEEKRLE